jgi:hypothetical protein
MKKNVMNFWVDVIIFVDLIAVMFTGVLIHRFPYELKEGTILGFPRYEWGDLHWVLALFLILLILLHLALHWTWAKVTFNKHLRLEPKVVAITAIGIILFCGALAPIVLTKDFPNRKLLRDAYRASYTLELQRDTAPQKEQGRDSDDKSTKHQSMDRN